MITLSIVIILFVLFLECTEIPARPALEEDIRTPSGKIEGNQFIGIPYSFNVSAPPNWKITAEFPDFMEKLEHDIPFSTDQEQTELYAYNPETRSNIAFHFTPADRYRRFSRKQTEWLAAFLTKIMVSELEKERGMGVANIDVGPTEAIPLNGVQYAAKKSVTYTVQGAKREQGWIYGFAEPYQILILYRILGRDGVNDHQGMKQILDSFEAKRKK